MVKKNTAVFLILSMTAMVVFALISRSLASVAAENRQIKIVASFYPMYIMARNVAKDVPGVVVTNLTPPITGCLHDYTLTTNDMKKFADADIFVANGAGMESFLQRITAQYPRLRILTLSEGIALIKGQGETGDNPHVWVSISNAIVEVNNLGRDLGKIDPDHALLYSRNTAEYTAKLEALRLKMQTELTPYKGRKIITFHEAFPYFAQEFGFEIAAVIEREPGSEPSAKELAETVDIVNESGIKALFSEPQYSSAAAQTIANETKAKVYILDPGVNGPDELNAYLDTMEKNVEVLKNAFAK